ncbi:hypothetical protein ABTL76_19785, partial [Acinetobacter baumannii]
LEISDIAIGYPGLAEAFLRLYTAYREEQLALADRQGPGLTGPSSGGDLDASDPVAEVRRFLAARRNNFADLDDAAERILQGPAD